MNPIDTAASTKSPASPEIANLAYQAAEAAYFRGQTPGQRIIPAGFTEIAHSGEMGRQMARADAIHLRADNGVEIVAFRGTAAGKDWGDNAKQVLGSPIARAMQYVSGKSPKSLRSDKYDAAAKIGAAFRDDNKSVIFTGHSLGGGLAKLAGEVASTQQPGGQTPKSANVISFNGAPVTPQTYKYYGCKTRDHLRTTTHFINVNDPLNRMIKGGKAHAIGGDVITSRAGGNTTLVHVRGGGDGMGVPGHGLKSFDTTAWANGKKNFNAPAFDVHGQAMNLSEFDSIVKTPVHDPAALAQLGLAAQQKGKELQPLKQTRGESLGR